MASPDPSPARPDAPALAEITKELRIDAELRSLIPPQAVKVVCAVCTAYLADLKRYFRKQRAAEHKTQPPKPA